MPWLTTTCPAMPRLTTVLLYILLMLMLGASAQSSNAKLKAPSSVSLVSSRERCLVDEPVPERKFLTHNSDKQVITLLGSQRIASRYFEDEFSMINGFWKFQIACFHFLNLSLSLLHLSLLLVMPYNISFPGYLLLSSLSFTFTYFSFIFHSYQYFTCRLLAFTFSNHYCQFFSFHFHLKYFTFDPH